MHSSILPIIPPCYSLSSKLEPLTFASTRIFLHKGVLLVTNFTPKQCWFCNDPSEKQQSLSYSYNRPINITFILVRIIIIHCMYVILILQIVTEAILRFRGEKKSSFWCSIMFCIYLWDCQNAVLGTKSTFEKLKMMQANCTHWQSGFLLYTEKHEKCALWMEKPCFVIQCHKTCQFLI